MSVLEKLLQRISEVGPIPFEEFQETALYGIDGFYSSSVLRSSKAGDFLTSPEVSPLFGETIGLFVESEIGRVGPDGFELVEVGGGSGSLLEPLVAGLGSVEVTAIEKSPSARARLAQIVGSEQVHDSEIAISDSFRGVIVANELLDNMSVAIATRKADNWRELWVGADGNRLVLVDAPARVEVADWCDRFGLPCPEGGVVEVQLAASAWVESMTRRIEGGALLLIDYGDFSENLEDRRSDGTLRTYRSHTRSGHPLDNPGASDVTVDVNFSAMADAAKSAGAEVEILRQDEFLGGLGLRERLSSLRNAALGAAREGDTHRQLRLKSEAKEVETLLAPRGLGEFKVLVARCS